ncbi:uncharacterized protein CANTADRAFT_21299 [Suhomyces tanzawaensis NRRL Y-17324]|uniref:Flo11 domain-containing protein n=1 Tax=Suhomyces tanzawaensis NRRL Y-17324 TaxID=984487 RepID=A0A1E4SKK8_9ASCO|nr:uncharacterized protein CANTADRAFT_21299 [Suhomyces tanzawaensis NRRL Y-17324]ODV80033.1 hypothetical protein CANTADRAFT_21299 [Suhomyces tanzawaensis NRRL Y-17324]
MKTFSGNVPQASFSVSDVAWVKDDLFKVTINFETIESAKLFAKFQDELSDLKLENTGVEDEILMWDGSSHSKIDNFSKWSSTVLVKASKHNDLYCLPDDFAIKFNWNARDTSELHAQWSKYFDTTYEYTLSKDFGTSLTSTKNIKIERRCMESSSNSTSIADANYDVGVLEQWQASSNVLPNFCWTKHCSA